ncbi:MAG: glycosyltransferase family 4 protein [Candidatus Sumerlaeia bacterium]|nr:glycosyltransferase family 4 protein [Candidatus Sumerlaeia bacterium]
MHLLLVSRSFPHHRPGGMEWHVQDLAAGLMEAGHTVSVLTTPLPEKPALAPLKVNGEILFAGERPGLYDKRFFWDLLRPAMKERINALGPDVIHCQGFAGIPAWKGLGNQFPVVTTIHGTLWSETALRHGGVLPQARGDRMRLHWRFKHRHLFEPFWRWFLSTKPRRRPPFLVVDSRFSLRELSREARWPRGSRPPLAIVPRGFDLTRFPMIDRDEAARAWGKSPGSIWLVGVGRLEKLKAFDILMEVFLRVADEFPSLELVIAGTGTEWKSLAAYRRTLPPALRARVHLPGSVPGHVESTDQRDLPSLLAAADIFLNADQGSPAFGLANAEALTMGTPVLASANGAHGEVVRNTGDGILVKGGIEEWTEVLRDQLVMLPEAEPSRARRAERARKRYSRERMVERMVAVYTKARKHHGEEAP